MRVWKIEACRDEERITSRWGYALAETAHEAKALAAATSGLPHNWAHEKHPDMLWPGRSGEQVYWG